MRVAERLHRKVVEPVLLNEAARLIWAADCTGGDNGVVRCNRATV